MSDCNGNALSLQCGDELLRCRITQQSLAVECRIVDESSVFSYYPGEEVQVGKYFCEVFNLTSRNHDQDAARLAKSAKNFDRKFVDTAVSRKRAVVVSCQGPTLHTAL